MNTVVTQYDSGIIPTEVAARKQREGGLFGTTAKANERVPGSINTTSGYTIDQEGLANNYAVEPEMYINEPGDLRQENAELAAKRVYELKALAENAVGQLTMEDDTRHKGPGRI
jgi:hypothetical protein